MLSPKTIDEYKEIHKKVFGEELTNEEVTVAANRLINFFSLLIEINRISNEKQITPHLNSLFWLEANFMS